MDAEPTGPDTDELTSAQVADYLGVKLETVYAYVSRGVLRPLRREVPGGSVFALTDVRALTAVGRPPRRRRRTASAGEDVRTRITRIHDDRLFYRGQDVAALVSRHSYEQVCALLWQTGEVDFTVPDADLRALRAFTGALPPQVSVVDRLRHAVLIAGSLDAGRHDLATAAVVEAGRRTAALMALALPDAEAAPRLSGILAAHFSGAEHGDLDAALVLLADHDLAVSTTALRVAISARTDPYSAFLAALSAADSPVHMGASRVALRWLSAAVTDPRAALDEALVSGRPPGFGHTVYREVDPRAEVLLGRVLPRADRTLRAAVDLLCGELLERRGWPANIDLALAVMTLVDDLPPEFGQVVFACARVAGWTAHAVEELQEPPLRFRLHGLYTGERH